MQLELGRHSFDVSTQALVLATVRAGAGDAGWVRDHADHGANGAFVLGVGDELVACIERNSDAAIPLIAATSDAALADRCLRAGASAIDAGHISDPAMLDVIAQANAAIVVVDIEWSEASLRGLTAERRAQGLQSTIERARWAEAAGIDRSRIILKAPTDQVEQLAEHGYVVAVTTAEDDPMSQGKQVAAVMAGARVINSNQVRATKRTVSTVAELLQRRGVVAPHAVEFAGAH